VPDIMLTAPFEDAAGEHNTAPPAVAAKLDQPAGSDNGNRREDSSDTTVQSPSDPEHKTQLA